jgi:hypothetical protein
MPVPQELKVISIQYPVVSNQWLESPVGTSSCSSGFFIDGTLGRAEARPYREYDY